MSSAWYNPVQSSICPYDYPAKRIMDDKEILTPCFRRNVPRGGVSNRDRRVGVGVGAGRRVYSLKILHECIPVVHLYTTYYC
jgi:hypothetical protein